jgi:hypothetical protein
MLISHRKHIKSLLRVQQFNAIYMFVTMVYQYNHHSSGHHPFFYLNYDISETGICFLLQAEPTQVSPIEKASLCLLSIGHTRVG